VDDDHRHEDRVTPAANAHQDDGRLLMDETEPRALGLPLRWFRTNESIDLRWARHPRRWIGWRLEVWRRGPYAPRFEDYRPGGRRGSE
jgi:hypothetical protein